MGKRQGGGRQAAPAALSDGVRRWCTTLHAQLQGSPGQQPGAIMELLSPAAKFADQVRALRTISEVDAAAAADSDTAAAVSSLLVRVVCDAPSLQPSAIGAMKRFAAGSDPSTSLSASSSSCSASSAVKQAWHTEVIAPARRHASALLAEEPGSESGAVLGARLAGCVVELRLSLDNSALSGIHFGSLAAAHHPAAHPQHSSQSSFGPDGDDGNVLVCGLASALRTMPASSRAPGVALTAQTLYDLVFSDVKSDGSGQEAGAAVANPASSSSSSSSSTLAVIAQSCWSCLESMTSELDMAAAEAVGRLALACLLASRQRCQPSPSSLSTWLLTAVHQLAPLAPRQPSDSPQFLPADVMPPRLAGFGSGQQAVVWRCSLWTPFVKEHASVASCASFLGDAGLDLALNEPTARASDGAGAASLMQKVWAHLLDLLEPGQAPADRRMSAVTLLAWCRRVTADSSLDASRRLSVFAKKGAVTGLRRVLAGWTMDGGGAIPWGGTEARINLIRSFLDVISKGQSRFNYERLRCCVKMVLDAAFKQPPHKQGLLVLAVAIVLPHARASQIVECAPHILSALARSAVVSGSDQTANTFVQLAQGFSSELSSAGNAADARDACAHALISTVDASANLKPLSLMLSSLLENDPTLMDHVINTAKAHKEGSAPLLHMLRAFQGMPARTGSKPVCMRTLFERAVDSDGQNSGDLIFGSDSELRWLLLDTLSTTAPGNALFPSPIEIKLVVNVLQVMLEVDEREEAQKIVGSFSKFLDRLMPQKETAVGKDKVRAATSVQHETNTMRINTLYEIKRVIARHILAGSSSRVDRQEISVLLLQTLISRVSHFRWPSSDDDKTVGLLDTDLADAMLELLYSRHSSVRACAFLILSDESITWKLEDMQSFFNRAHAMLCSANAADYEGGSLGVLLLLKRKLINTKTKPFWSQKQSETSTNSVKHLFDVMLDDVSQRSSSIADAFLNQDSSKYVHGALIVVRRMLENAQDIGLTTKNVGVSAGQSVETLVEACVRSCSSACELLCDATDGNEGSRDYLVDCRGWYTVKDAKGFGSQEEVHCKETLVTTGCCLTIKTACDCLSTLVSRSRSCGWEQFVTQSVIMRIAEHLINTLRSCKNFGAKKDLERSLETVCKFAACSSDLDLHVVPQHCADILVAQVRASGADSYLCRSAGLRHAFRAVLACTGASANHVALVCDTARQLLDLAQFDAAAVSEVAINACNALRILFEHTTSGPLLIDKLASPTLKLAMKGLALNDYNYSSAAMQLFPAVLHRVLTCMKASKAFNTGGLKVYVQDFFTKIEGSQETTMSMLSDRQASASLPLSYPALLLLSELGPSLNTTQMGRLRDAMHACDGLSSFMVRATQARALASLSQVSDGLQMVDSVLRLVKGAEDANSLHAAMLQCSALLERTDDSLWAVPIVEELFQRLLGTGEHGLGNNAVVVCTLCDLAEKVLDLLADTSVASLQILCESSVESSLRRSRPLSMIPEGMQALCTLCLKLAVKQCRLVPMALTLLQYGDATQAQLEATETTLAFLVGHLAKGAAVGSTGVVRQLNAVIWQRLKVGHAFLSLDCDALRIFRSTAAILDAKAVSLDKWVKLEQWNRVSELSQRHARSSAWQQEVCLCSGHLLRSLVRASQGKWVTSADEYLLTLLPLLDGHTQSWDTRLAAATSLEASGLVQMSMSEDIMISTPVLATRLGSVVHSGLYDTDAEVADTFCRIAASSMQAWSVLTCTLNGFVVSPAKVAPEILAPVWLEAIISAMLANGQDEAAAAVITGALDACVLLACNNSGFESLGSLLAAQIANVSNDTPLSFEKADQDGFADPITAIDALVKVIIRVDLPEQCSVLLVPAANRFCSDLMSLIPYGKKYGGLITPLLRSVAFGYCALVCVTIMHSSKANIDKAAGAIFASGATSSRSESGFSVMGRKSIQQASTWWSRQDEGSVLQPGHAERTRKAVSDLQRDLSVY